MIDAINEMIGQYLGRSLSDDESRNLNSLIHYEIDNAIRSNIDLSMANLGRRIPIIVARFINNLRG